MSFDRFKVDAPMSRLEEVEARIISADGAYHDGAWIGPESLRHLARTLAAEVDELREELKAVREGKTELDGIMEAMTKGANEADIITKLLAILKPDKHRPSWEHDEYRRACEIAGRTE